MAVPELIRYVSSGVTLLGDTNRPGGVTLAFTERTGGVSAGEFASLNLGSRCGDDPAAVEENRRRAIAALGAGAYGDALVTPHQVHGDHVVVIDANDAASVEGAQREAQAGADAIVCTARRVPVLLCFADCVPVILACEGGFAVVHSGWRGTMARIASKALGVLADEAGVARADVRAYIGPHIGPADYEVSVDLAEQFAAEFGRSVLQGERNLDLGRAVSLALEQGGARAEHVVSYDVSTASATDRFYSYRAESGTCGRHGALACLL